VQKEASDPKAWQRTALLPFNRFSSASPDKRHSGIQLFPAPRKSCDEAIPGLFPFSRWKVPYRRAIDDARSEPRRERMMADVKSAQEVRQARDKVWQEMDDFFDLHYPFTEDTYLHYAILSKKSVNAIETFLTYCAPPPKPHPPESSGN